MYLYLIPSLYLLAYLLFFLILNWWLGNAFAGYLEMKRWRRIFFFIVYVLAAPPILGCFLPDSKVKFVLTAVGNIWLGYFLYIGIIAVPLSIIAGVSGLMRGENTRRNRSTARLTCEYRLKSMRVQILADRLYLCGFSRSIRTFDRNEQTSHRFSPISVSLNDQVSHNDPRTQRRFLLLFFRAGRASLSARLASALAAISSYEE